jgi:hypothetical protein
VPDPTRSGSGLTTLGTFLVLLLHTASFYSLFFQDNLSDYSAEEENIESSPAASGARKRWSKTISFELTPERVLSACSLAVNLVVVYYYFSYK